MMKYLQLMIMVALLAYQGMRSIPQNEFLRKFQLLNGSSSLTDSTGHIETVDGDHFTGILVNANEVNNRSDLQLFLPEIGQTYGCFYFSVDAEIYGLIIRTPSFGLSNSVKLCLYRKRSNEVFQCLEIAEAYGAGGYELIRSSTLDLSGSNCVLKVKTKACNADENFANTECNERSINYNITVNGLEVVSQSPV